MLLRSKIIDPHLRLQTVPLANHLAYTSDLILRRAFDYHSTSSDLQTKALAYRQLPTMAQYTNLFRPHPQTITRRGSPRPANRTSYSPTSHTPVSSAGFASDAAATTSGHEDTAEAALRTKPLNSRHATTLLPPRAQLRPPPAIGIPTR